jgi:hypothetical protein
MRIYCTDGKGKAVPLQAWTGPQGSRRLRHMNVVTLSALRTGRVYPPGNILGTHFCYRLSRPQGHSAAGRIMSMKNSNDTKMGGVGLQLHSLTTTLEGGECTELLFMALQPLMGQGLLIIEASRSHSDTPHSVGLLWTSDRPVAETST